MEKVTSSLVDIEILRIMDLEQYEESGEGELKNGKTLIALGRKRPQLVAFAKAEAQKGVNYRNSLRSIT